MGPTRAWMPQCPVLPEGMDALDCPVLPEPPLAVGELVDVSIPFQHDKMLSMYWSNIEAASAPQGRA